MTNTHAHEEYPDTHHDTYTKTIFGFWVYLLTDLVLFAVLFAVYVVLEDHRYGGPSAKELFSIKSALFTSVIFLISSFTIGLGGAFAHQKKRGKTLLFFMLTFLLGIVLCYLQMGEWHELDMAGHSWKNSAFLSAYFVLTGTHLIHLVFALLWTPLLLFPVVKEGITDRSIMRLTCLRMFWQFLNIIWIFIFTIVYLLGAL